MWYLWCKFFWKKEILKGILNQFTKERSLSNVIFVMQHLLANKIWEDILNSFKCNACGSFFFPKRKYESSCQICSWKRKGIQMYLIISEFYRNIFGLPPTYHYTCQRWHFINFEQVLILNYILAKPSRINWFISLLFELWSFYNKKDWKRESTLT